MRARQARVTSSGQISLPADVRRRWGATSVLILDHGDKVVVEPMPEDPVLALKGSLAGPGPMSDVVRDQEREDEADAEEERWS